jgi:hypothetical protein
MRRAVDATRTRARAVRLTRVRKERQEASK